MKMPSIKSKPSTRYEPSKKTEIPSYENHSYKSKPSTETETS